MIWMDDPGKEMHILLTAVISSFEGNAKPLVQANRSC